MEELTMALEAACMEASEELIPWADLEVLDLENQRALKKPRSEAYQLIIVRILILYS